MCSKETLMHIEQELKIWLIVLIVSQTQYLTPTFQESLESWRQKDNAWNVYGFCFCVMWFQFRCNDCDNITINNQISCLFKPFFSSHPEYLSFSLKLLHWFLVSKRIYKTYFPTFLNALEMSFPCFKERPKIILKSELTKCLN